MVPDRRVNLGSMGGIGLAAEGELWMEGMGAVWLYVGETWEELDVDVVAEGISGSGWVLAEVGEGKMDTWEVVVDVDEG